METIGAANISIVTNTLGLERDELLGLLQGLDEADWERPTECPAYPVKGIATHILGDDLSLLSRQRDAALPGVFLVAEKMPGVDFRTLLNTLNDEWVEAARFLSAPLLIELLRLSGKWSSAFYTKIDPATIGEPVPMFSPASGQGSPFWQAIAREYLERWAHHSQIRRALGRPSLADGPFLEVGAQIVATVAGAEAASPLTSDDVWAIGEVVLGPAQQAADILTLAYTEPELHRLLQGPTDLVDEFAARVARRP